MDNATPVSGEALRGFGEVAYGGSDQFMVSNLDVFRLLESVPAGVLVHAADGRIRYVNPEAARLLGLHQDQLLGRRFDDPAWELLDGDGAPLPLSAHPFNRVMNEGQPIYNLMLGAALSTGRELRWMRVNAYLDVRPPDRFVVVTFTDTALSPQRTYAYQEAFELVDEAIVITSADRTDPNWPRITYVNAACCSLSGYSRRELIGASPRLLQGEGTDRQALDRIREALDAGRPVRETLLNYQKGGRPYWLDISISPLHDSWGNISHFIALQRDVSHLKQEALTQRRAAERDPLTRLRNRRGFDAKLQALIAKGALGSTFAVVVLDIDHFKRINDSLGHDQGDIVLVRLSELLRRNLRRRDIVARFGGEEFVVLLPDVGRDIAFQTAERLREQVAAIDEPVPFSISLGIACSRQPVERFRSVLTRADRALYAAKSAGRNRTEVAAD